MGVLEYVELNEDNLAAVLDGVNARSRLEEYYSLVVTPTMEAGRKGRHGHGAQRGCTR
jgi:hypothetical protein